LKHKETVACISDLKDTGESPVKTEDYSVKTIYSGSIIQWDEGTPLKEE
jgi:hypothetical protein